MKNENYESPEVQVINLGAEGVLCASSLSADNGSLETWETDEFVW